MGYESKRGIGHLQEQQRLRNFAARVTDEAHFQRILDDTKPGYRDAVEAALRPWLRFTQAPVPVPIDDVPVEVFETPPAEEP